MRFRFTVALYSDTQLEAEIADYLAGMPRSRRQEVHRMLLKLGYAALMQNKGVPQLNNDLPLPNQREESKSTYPSRQHRKRQGVIKDSRSSLVSKPIEQENITSQENGSPVIYTEKGKRIHKNAVDETKNENMAQQQEQKLSISKKDLSDDSNMDPLKKINLLFDGISNE